MLSDYIERVMEEKGLTAKDIERRSGGKIADSTIGNIRKGRTKNLSVEKINALAEGLGVDPVEVFQATSGKEAKREATASRLAYIIQKLADNSDLLRLAEIIVRLKPAKIKSLLRSLESKSD